MVVAVAIFGSVATLAAIGCISLALAYRSSQKINEEALREAWAANAQLVKALNYVPPPPSSMPGIDEPEEVEEAQKTIDHIEAGGVGFEVTRDQGKEIWTAPGGKKYERV